MSKTKKKPEAETVVVEAVVEPPVAPVETFDGTPFRGGVILKDGRWTAALAGCKGTCEYMSKAGKKLICAILDYRRIKAGTMMYTLVFIDRTNPERVTSTASKDKWGNTQVGFPAWVQAEAKPGAGYIRSLSLSKIG